MLRILFAGATMHLLEIIGLTLAGGILLLWVSWKMYREIRAGHMAPAEDAAPVPPHCSGPKSSDPTPAAPGAADAAPRRKTTAQAMLQVVIADVSMSLDNVLAVAGVEMDRKVLAELAVKDPKAFGELAALAKSQAA